MTRSAATLLAALLLAVIAACGGGSDVAGLPAVQEVVVSGEAQLPLDAAFRDEMGRAVKLGDFFGDKPVILTFVYYDCPMLCTMILNGLAKALAVLTFDPGRE